MMGKQVGETVLAQALAHEPLQDVHVGVAVAFDEHRSVVEDRDIPADHHPIVEFAMRRDRQLLHFAPERQRPPFYLRSSIRMDREPAEPRIRPEVCRARQLGGAEVDVRRNAARVQIVDRAVRADRHAEDAPDHLGLAAFVEAADDPHGRKCSVADVRQP
jgi:hypothetical protein